MTHLAIDIIMTQHQVLRQIARELLAGQPSCMSTKTILSLAETIALVDLLLTEAQQLAAAAQSRAERN